MGRVELLEHAGKRIVAIDFSHCGPAQLGPLFDEAKKLIAAQGTGAALTLTDVTETRFDDEISKSFKTYLEHNKPFVKAAAVLGLSGLRKALFTAINVAVRRDVRPFDDRESALTWLASQ